MALAWKAGWEQSLKGSNPLSSAAIINQIKEEMLNIWKVRPILIIVKRIQIFLKINLNYLVQSFNWLIKSREFTNYTYKLTEVNLNQIKGMLSFILMVRYLSDSSRKALHVTPIN